MKIEGTYTMLGVMYSKEIRELGLEGLAHLLNCHFYNDDYESLRGDLPTDKARSLKQDWASPSCDMPIIEGNKVYYKDEVIATVQHEFRAVVMYSESCPYHIENIAKLLNYTLVKHIKK